MSLTHNFNLIASLMKPSFNPGSGGSIPAGTHYTRLTADSSTWNVGNLALDVRDYDGVPDSSLAQAVASARAYINIEKTSNGCEIKFYTERSSVEEFEDANEGADQDFWWSTATNSYASLPASPNGTTSPPTFPIALVYEHTGNIDFTSFKIVLPVRQNDQIHNSPIPPFDTIAVNPDQGGSFVAYDDSSQPWNPVSNTGDEIRYRLIAGAIAQRQGFGQDITNAPQRTVEIWGRAQNYNDTLLATYTIMAQANAELV